MPPARLACFGYRSQEVENDDAGEGRGRAKSLGTRQYIIGSEAITIRRIWESFADGRSMRAIARDLKADGVPGPRKTTAHPGIHDWNTVLIGRILRRHEYVGMIICNKTHQIQDPRPDFIPLRFSTSTPTSIPSINRAFPILLSR